MTFVSLTTKRKISLQLKGPFINVSYFRLIMILIKQLFEMMLENIKVPGRITDFAEKALVSLNQVIQKDAKYIRYFV